MSPISVDLAKLGDSLPAILWEKSVSAYDCGDEMARWLSRFLLQQDVGVRLVYYPKNKPAAEPRERDKVFPLFDKADTVSHNNFLILEDFGRFDFTSTKNTSL